MLFERYGNVSIYVVIILSLFKVLMYVNTVRLHSIRVNINSDWLLRVDTRSVTRSKYIQ